MSLAPGKYKLWYKSYRDLHSLVADMIQSYCLLSPNPFRVLKSEDITFHPPYGKILSPILGPALHNCIMGKLHLSLKHQLLTVA